MVQNRAFLVCFVLFILMVDCFGVDSEVKATNQSTIVGTQNSVTLNDTSIVKTQVVVADKQVKSGIQEKGNQVVVNQQVVKDDPVESSLTKEVDSKKDPAQVLTNTNDSSKEVGEKKKDEKRQGDVEKPEKVLKKEHKDGDSKPTRKEENARGEECDPSNMCKDEKSGLIACLRVPGNDSPDYSLLIQNKGTSPLSISISAPKYVRLEESTIQILQKEDKKVKVTIGDGDNNTSIILSAGNGQCNLDFRDLVLHNSETKSSNSKKFSYTDLRSRVSSIVYISLAAMFLVGSVTLFVKLRKRNLLSGEIPKYQKLETELPVTNPTIIASPEVTDVGWDNSWGDDSWDDEEAPKTPSLPVTPSLSSKGLSARRSTKDGWKD